MKCMRSVLRAVRRSTSPALNASRRAAMVASGGMRTVNVAEALLRLARTWLDKICISVAVTTDEFGSNVMTGMHGG